MFQQTLNRMMEGSRAVLTRPSVSTFEEFEQNDLQNATIYVAIAALISGILSAIGGALGAASNAGIISTVIGVLIGFFVWNGVVFFLGRAFGGTGQFGELAFDVSLFYAPLLIIFNFLSMIAIGPLSILTSVAGIVVWAYQLYLTYLGIQSGMNLPSNKAMYVIGILFLVGLAIVACIALVFGAAMAAIMSNSN